MRYAASIKLLNVLLLLASISVFGQDFNSVQDGDWATNSTWVETGTPGYDDWTALGPYWGCKVLDGLVVYIFDEVILDPMVGLCLINGAELHIYGKLTVKGYLRNNGSTVHVYSSGSLIIDPDLGDSDFADETTNTNGASLINEGDFTLVDGDLVNDVTSTVDNSGTMDVDDDITNDGTFINTGTLTYGGEMDGLIPLPIDLVFFNVISGNYQVLIDWQTASEENNDYFTIERSANGYDFEELAFIYGAGNSSVAIDYSYIDNNPLSGISYYRLKQTDYDGVFEVFDITAVNNTLSYASSKSIVLTTEGEQFIFELDQNRSHVTLELFDMNGRLIKTQQSSSTNRVVLETSFILSGIYIIRLHDNAGLYYTEKVHFD